MVMDKVMDVIDYVMTETIADDKCYECDGIFQKSPELENSIERKLGCNTNKQGQKESKVINNEFSKMPSQVEQSESRNYTEYEVEEERDTITVGGLVTVEDCPGHWSWASPFTVEAIEGEMAKLEMVSELVEIAYLSKCPK